MDQGGAILILAAVALAMIWLARVYGPKAKALRDTQDARDFEHEQVILREQYPEPVAKPKRAPNGRFLPKGRG